MKSSSVCLLLGASVLLLSGPTVSTVSLTVSPNLQQFFRRSKVTLSCDEDGQTVDGWTVKRTAGGQINQCGGGPQDFGRTEGSFCIISGLLPSDSGVYWCESSSGQSSEQINITVTDDQIILEIPALPVRTGSDVTLRCRSRNGSTQSADLLKNSRSFKYGPNGEFIISNIQQSDEDFYSCFVHPKEFSRSRLRVKASPPAPLSSSSSSPPFLCSTTSPTPGTSNSTIAVVAAVGSLVLLVLLLVAVLLLWRKQTGKTDSHPPADTTYADITISQAANRRDKHPADPEIVYSGINTHTAVTSSTDQKKRRSKKRERGPDPLYCTATQPPGPDEVTYGQVVTRGQGLAGVRHAPPSEPDVVYSSVRAGK